MEVSVRDGVGHSVGRGGLKGMMRSLYKRVSDFRDACTKMSLQEVM
jgi:hypothetical protein